MYIHNSIMHSPFKGFKKCSRNFFHQGEKGTSISNTHTTAGTTPPLILNTCKFWPSKKEMLKLMNKMTLVVMPMMFLISFMWKFLEVSFIYMRIPGFITYVEVSRSEGNGVICVISRLCIVIIYIWHLSFLLLICIGFCSYFLTSKNFILVLVTKEKWHDIVLSRIFFLPFSLDKTPLIL